MKNIGNFISFRWKYGKSCHRCHYEFLTVKCENCQLTEKEGGVYCPQIVTEEYWS